MRGKILGIISIVLTAIVLLFVAFMLAGVLEFKSGSSVDTADYKVVCDAKIVREYNIATAFIYDVKADKSSQDLESAKSILKDITSKPEYKQDPTCQVIVFWESFRAGNDTEARGAYDILKTMHEQRIFADSDLRDAGPIDEYARSLDLKNKKQDIPDDAASQ